MLGKSLSIISAIGLINSFHMAWYKFTGVNQVTPLDVMNYYISQPINADSIWKIATMAAIPLLGGLMILTAIFPKLFLSLIKLILAVFLVFIHVGYFYSVLQSSTSPFDWINIISSSPGFLLFLGAIILYFISVILAIIFSPFRGLAKLIGL